MKKIMIFAAACAALVACSKEAETVVDANHFEKGQEVTLTVKAGESSTRVSSALNSSSGIDFKWEATDIIKVTVGGKDAAFSISKLIKDGESAEFKGTMPGSGETFKVQYPYDAPILLNQIYPTNVNEALPHNMMLFTAEDCDLENPFTLTANNAALRLNLWGTDQIISKIKVTNITTEKTYTLAMDPAVTLPTTEDAAQAFFIIVDADDEECTFSAEVFDNSSNPVSICTFTTSTEQKFEANKILNMAAKEVKKSSTEPTFTVDAKGNKVYFSPGNLYYNGTKFVFEEKQYEYHSRLTTDDDKSNGLIRWATNGGEQNLQTDINNAMASTTSSNGFDKTVFFTNDTESTPRSNFTVGEDTGIWRTLSNDEWTYLFKTRSITYHRCAEVQVCNTCGLLIFPDTFTWPLEKNREPETFDSPCTNWGGVNYTTDEFGKLETAGCVFLPAAGGRNRNKENGVYIETLDNVGIQGTYWTSTGLEDSRASRWTFNCDGSSGEFESKGGERRSGRSVRLVRKAN